MPRLVHLDPKGSDFAAPRRHPVQPDSARGGRFLRREVVSAEDVLELGQGLREFLGNGWVLVTRGAEGMILFGPGRNALYVPAQAREIFDVTGAGDTVAATPAVALATGVGVEKPAHLASRAAAVVVVRVGTASVRLDELL